MAGRDVTQPGHLAPSAQSTAPGRTGGAVAAGAKARDGNTRPGWPVFWRCFTASDCSTRGVLADLVADLSDAGLAAEDLFNAELVLAEVLNNVAEHAYAEGGGPVELRVEVRHAGLACMVADRGRPLPAGVVPNPELPLIAPPDHLPEGGFGWHIIRCLTCDMAYCTDGEWNRLSMRVPWAA